MTLVVIIVCLIVYKFSFVCNPTVHSFKQSYFWDSLVVLIIKLSVFPRFIIDPETTKLSRDPR